MMEFQAGNLNAAQNVYQRSIRDSIATDDSFDNREKNIIRKNTGQLKKDKILKKSKEVEVSRWKSSSSDAESSFGDTSVWMNDGSIEGKVPSATMRKKNKKRKDA